MTTFFLFIGLGIFLFGGIAFLIAAFRTSILWGLCCVFIAPVQIIYLFAHWDDAKNPFLIQVIGGVIMLIAGFLQGGIPEIGY